MRKISRPNLELGEAKYLAKKSTDIAAGRDVEMTWNYARRTKKMRRVASVLASMAGRRSRCMFCEDSHGIDIDHFWPKSEFPAKAFLWSNLLLVCAGCNRLKAAKFPLDRSGMPFFIDPTSEDPWDFLFYDEMTGLIVGRFEPENNCVNPRGDFTVDRSNLVINYDCISRARMATSRNLYRSVKAFLSSMSGGGELGAAERELLAAVEDNDCYGLAHWYFVKDGLENAIFKKFGLDFPSILEKVRASIS